MTWDSSPVAIVLAPIGAEVTRDAQPALPHTPVEIVDSTLEAVAEGAAIVHLHVREPDGTPSARPELFAETIEALRERCDVVTMVSTGGSIDMSVEERLTGLAARPDMAGIETGSLNFGDGMFLTPPEAIREIAAAATSQGIALEVEAFELGHLHTAIKLCETGVLPAPLRVNVVLGVPGALAATSEALLAMRRALPPGTPWAVTAVGRHQRRMLALGILLGATAVRVGFEDNIYLRKGVLATSNADLVRDVAQLIRQLGRDVATPSETRTLLGLPPLPAELQA
jgi:3-keto-5-aminohexanoate cleavage enzyme